MFKKGKTSAVICLLLILVVSFAPAVNAVSWTVLEPADYIQDIYYAGNFRYVAYDFKRTPLIYWVHAGTTGTSMGSVNVAEWNSAVNLFRFTSFPLGTRAVGGPPLSSGSSGGIAISLQDFKPSAAFTLLSEINMEMGVYYESYDTPLDEKISVDVTTYFYRYDANGGYKGSYTVNEPTQTFTLQDVQGGQFAFDIPLDINVSISSFGDGVCYVVPLTEVTLKVLDDEPDIDWDYVRMTCYGYSMTTRTDMLLQESLTMQEINDKLDQIIQQPENEKQEATDEGGELADQLTGALPDQSQGFMAAIRQLANAMSYEGTDAQLTFPAITLPEIPGVMKSYKLSEEMPIDFGFWVQKIPDKVLTLVQVISTLALVVFAFKELYSMISYAMTLKRGEGE